MEVPFVDLKAQARELHDEFAAAFESVTSRAAYTMGPELADFEAAFAAFCGTEHCVGVSSGTDAVKLALLGAGVGPGDEVVVPANTFIATAEAVSHLGATPIFCDCSPHTALLDPDALVAVCEEREGMLSAVVPVHLYGQPCDMDPILAIAEEHGLAVVEDACQAHGALYAGAAEGDAPVSPRASASPSGAAEPPASPSAAEPPAAGRPCGSFGVTAAFSFYPGKNLGALGDGGAVVTSDNAVAERLRLLRNHGQAEKQVHTLVGYCDRLHNLQAAFLRIKLEHLPAWNAARREAAAYYDERLRDIPGVAPIARRAPLDEPVYHLYVVRLLTGSREEDADTDLAERLLADELERRDRDAAELELGFDDPGLVADEHPIAGVAGVDQATLPDLSGRGLQDIQSRGEARDEVRERLAGAGVQSGIHYAVPLHMQPAYAHLGYRLGDFPAAERLATQVLSLPIFPEITRAQQDRVVAALVDALD
jgi:dTDP-3-amino-3,4,6-trideoxy-alpha-D-glucose transaminase